MVINKDFIFLLSLIIFNICIVDIRGQALVNSFTVGGKWQLLHPNVGISAMHMQLLLNNKVVMFDRTDFGPSNLSLPFGRCRFDSSDTTLQTDCTAHSLLYDTTTNTIRPLMVQTDTWCSSGSVLPDGTLLQTGGFNDGERTIRMLAACNGDQCDWTEYPEYLNVRRWYATNQILPNGRVIIIGGRRQHSYEFYPREPNFSSHELRFLRETRDGGNENNLYPFVHLLPDGNLFIFANTRSILLDYINNRVVREFPPIPGNEPRNYPSSGSSVLLPLQLSSDPFSFRTTEAEVLICGGVPQDGFMSAKQDNFLQASSSCGRIKVTDPNPSWEMEEMPMPRVMGNMLILPTGDVTIINGAGRGTAGWELARDPVTSPILYRTYERVLNQRFTIMSPSSTPRLYHSTAVLLPDGRILVGGSNPHRNYTFTNVLYRTELSVEAFSPPYLAPEYENIRPRIVSYSNIVNYGQPLQVTFEVLEYQAIQEVSVTVLAPSFSTHAFGMNQRMVALRVMGVTQGAFSRYEVSAHGPPADQIAPRGYYLLFVVHAGIPSSGVWVKIESAAESFISS